MKIEKAYIQRGQLIIIVAPSDAYATLKILKEELGYNQLSEMSAIDYLAKLGGFEVFYQLLSMSKAKRVRVKCTIKEDEKIESVSKLYSSANWAEREMYDLLGVKVNNHPMLKRIMLPDDWIGHPLRKTYPLQGDEHAHWYEVDKIYGKEARDIIGPELRDAAFIDRHDTQRFSRIGKEVGFGMPYSETDTPIKYQEDERPLLIDKFDPAASTEASRER
jgi:NADH-quinone oxidoreductase subunit C